MKQDKVVPWYVRLVQALGLQNKPRLAQQAIRGTSKHARAHARPRNWEKARKTRRLMAKESRRRNRRS